MMTSINGDTVITMTTKQLVGGTLAIAVLFAGTAWVVAQFTFGNMKDDVADIRRAVTDVQDRNAETHQSATTTDGKLSAEIADLTAQLKITNAGLENLTKSVAGLDESVKSVDSRLAASVLRQEKFESWVVTRLMSWL
jgi:uncharacterized protein YoxC